VTDVVRTLGRWGALLALALLATACPHLPARELYRLAVIDSAASPLIPLANGARPVLTGTMAIAPYTTPGIYGDAGIVYRVGDSQYGVYPSREWAIPLGDQLGMMTEQVMRRTPLTSGETVFRPASRRSHQYVWRGAVRRFDEVDRGKEVFASVQLEAQLVRVADDSVVWSGSASAEQLVTEPTMPHIVAVLSSISEELVQRLVHEARAAAAELADSGPRRQR
jgi:uncharacterized lipoprotein YmbA